MNVLKCILLQKVGFVKYKSGLLHGHKMKIEKIIHFLSRKINDFTNQEIPCLVGGGVYNAEFLSTAQE